MAISNICITAQMIQYNRVGVIKHLAHGRFIPFGGITCFTRFWFLNNLHHLLSVFRITEVLSLNLRRTKILNRHLLSAVNPAEELRLKDRIPCLFCAAQQWCLPPEWVLAACRSGGYEVPFSYVVLSAVTFPFSGLCSICISNKKMSKSVGWMLMMWLYPILKDIHKNGCIFLAGAWEDDRTGLLLARTGNCI